MINIIKECSKSFTKKKGKCVENMIIRVENELFYHAYSGKKINVGDILCFNSNTYNKMYDEVYKSNYNLDGFDANEVLSSKKKNKDMYLSKEECELLLNTISNDAFVLRELALEEFRKEKYPDYPSRLRCLYVSKEKNDALEWSKILKRNKKECKQVLTLELNGELIIGDGSLIKRQNISYQKQLENAEKYWNSKKCDIPEYLFYGRAKVVKIENIN